jgi:DNA-directed RNA polymerase subunit RPC12/RpoP
MICTECKKEVVGTRNLHNDGDHSQPRIVCGECLQDLMRKNEA